MAFELNYDESTLKKKLGNEFPEKFGALILMFASTKSTELQSFMQTNRVWTDRTGAAKANLRARVSQPSPQKVRITLSHGVEYGVWLELANEKNYAIISPTVRTQGPKVMADLNDLLGKLKL